MSKKSSKKPIPEVAEVAIVSMTSFTMSVDSSDRAATYASFGSLPLGSVFVSAGARGLKCGNTSYLSLPTAPDPAWVPGKFRLSKKTQVRLLKASIDASDDELLQAMEEGAAGG